MSSPPGSGGRPPSGDRGTRDRTAGHGSPEAPGGAEPAALEARALIRDFGPVRAVDQVDLRLRRGEFLALFGPNGAGKTSLLRLLGGELRPTGGDVLLGGRPLRSDRPEGRRQVGVLSHEGFLFGHLTAAENLRFYGRLYDLRDLDARVPERLDQVGLGGVAGRRVEGFSRGMRQRLAVARTLLHDPSVVLLDEPYTGLDAHAASLLRGILRSLRDGRRTVVLVTHHLREGLELADRALVLARGRVAHREDAPGRVDPDAFEVRYREMVEALG